MLFPLPNMMRSKAVEEVISKTPSRRAEGARQRASQEKTAQRARYAEIFPEARGTPARVPDGAHGDVRTDARSKEPAGAMDTKPSDKGRRLCVPAAFGSVECLYPKTCKACAI